MLRSFERRQKQVHFRDIVPGQSRSDSFTPFRHVLERPDADATATRQQSKQQRCQSAPALQDRPFCPHALTAYLREVIGAGGHTVIVPSFLQMLEQRRRRCLTWPQFGHLAQGIIERPPTIRVFHHALQRTRHQAFEQTDGGFRRGHVRPFKAIDDYEDCRAGVRCEISAATRRR